MLKLTQIYLDQHYASGNRHPRHILSSYLSTRCQGYYNNSFIKIIVHVIILFRYQYRIEMVINVEIKKIDCDCGIICTKSKLKAK